MTLPAISNVLANPTTSFWLADALRSALGRDPVDAANDAELLYDLLAAHADDALGTARSTEPEPADDGPFIVIAAFIAGSDDEPIVPVGYLVEEI